MPSAVLNSTDWPAAVLPLRTIVTLAIAPATFSATVNVGAPKATTGPVSLSTIVSRASRFVVPSVARPVAFERIRRTVSLPSRPAPGAIGRAIVLLVSPAANDSVGFIAV